jgi:hypothetical protein
MDYGISITKAGGKNKTIKELCAEMDMLEASKNIIPSPASISRPQSPVIGAVGPPIGRRSPSPVGRRRPPSPVIGAVGPPIGMARPPTPPIEEVITGMVPRAIVYSLLNIDREMTQGELIKSMKKPALVRYAEELGIRGKSLSKQKLLERIIAKKVIENTPVIAQAITAEASVITSEIEERVSERVENAGEEAPPQEEIQAVVEERIATGSPVTPEDVAEEIVAEQQSNEIIYPSKPISSASSSSYASSMSSILESSSASSSVKSSIAESVSIASGINSNIAEEIIEEVAEKISKRAVKETVKEIINKEPVDINVSTLEEVVTNEEAINAVEDVVSNALDEGAISKNESEKILQPLREEPLDMPNIEIEPVAGPSRLPKPVAGPSRLPEPVAGPSRLPKPVAGPSRLPEPVAGPSRLPEPVAGPSRSVRPKTARPKSTAKPKSTARPRSPADIRRRLTREDDIETMLREIQKPEENISNMPAIQHRVFRCLGLVN